MRQATLCLLIKENQNKKELLLAMKKRGFGKYKWNGVGGKLDLEKGDGNIADAAVRETKEEIGVKIKDLEKVAVLSFYNCKRGRKRKIYFSFSTECRNHVEHLQFSL